VNDLPSAYTPRTQRANPAASRASPAIRMGDRTASGHPTPRNPQATIAPKTRDWSTTQPSPRGPSAGTRVRGRLRKPEVYGEVGDIPPTA
jgi:hypothetical protein